MEKETEKKTVDQEKAAAAVTWLTSLFKGWGIKDKWAQLLAVIIVAVVATLYATGKLSAWFCLALCVLFLTGCSAGMTLTLKSDHGELEWTVEGGEVQPPPVVIPQKK